MVTAMLKDLLAQILHINTYMVAAMLLEDLLAQISRINTYMVVVAAITYTGSDSGLSNIRLINVSST